MGTNGLSEKYAEGALPGTCPAMGTVQEGIMRLFSKTRRAYRKVRRVLRDPGVRGANRYTKRRLTQKRRRR